MVGERLSKQGESDGGVGVSEHFIRGYEFLRAESGKSNLLRDGSCGKSGLLAVLSEDLVADLAFADAQGAVGFVVAAVQTFLALQNDHAAAQGAEYRTVERDFFKAGEVLVALGFINDQGIDGNHLVDTRIPVTALAAYAALFGSEKPV